MSINTVESVYFSPTGTTKKVLEGIAKGISAHNTIFSDLTKVNGNVDSNSKMPDLVIIGMPTYVSRIPPEGAALMKKLQGKNIPVVLITVYGNNKFGDALLEMKDIATSNGFIPVAAAAFIGEHSFSTKEKPIAADRPDAQDMAEAKYFGKTIKAIMLCTNENSAENELTVPGEFPYREWHKIPAQPPTSDENSCIKCGICKVACPVDAIQITSQVITDPELCIFCCACVKSCPTSARKVTDPKLLEVTDRLFNNCSERKEPEFFI